jgi:hypothetical protein
MIEYSLVLGAVLLTFIMGIVSVRVPLTGFIVVTLDLVMMVDVIMGGPVIIGYTYSSGVATAITQSYDWMPLTIVVAMLFCLAGGLIRMASK